MIEMRWRISVPLSAVRGMPATTADPDVGATSVPRVRTVVVFPAPFGPRKPKTSPEVTVKDTSSKAVRPPNRLVRWSTTRAGGSLDRSASALWPGTRSTTHRSLRWTRLRRAGECARTGGILLSRRHLCGGPDPCDGSHPRPLLTPHRGAGRMADRWMIRGTEFANCNCAWGCPCHFGALTTHGLRVDPVRTYRRRLLKETRLDGLNWSLLVYWPGEIAQGNGQERAIIDERADADQREAPRKILHGESTTPGATHF